MGRSLRFMVLVIVVALLASCGSAAPAASGRSGAAPQATGTAVPVGAGAAGTATATATSTAPPPTATPPRTPPPTPERVPGTAPTSCLLTRPTEPPFAPPSDITPSAGLFWHGTAQLWTEVRLDGTWRGLPYREGTFGQKVFWWRQGYDARSEPQPQIVVTGRRLDAPAPPLIASRPTNATAPDIGTAMLVGVDLPAPGCWEITGEYADTTLRFVVWVAP